MSFRRKAVLLRKSLQTHFWNADRQLFVDALIDGQQSKMFSEHSNGTALSQHIATQEQAELIAKELLAKDKHNYVRRASGLIMVTPAMSYDLHKGLCEYGYIDESFELFRGRFDKMLAPNTNGTLWEEWRLDGIGRSGKLQMGRTRSDAQTESAFAPALFAEFLLGIRPTRPGMKEVVLKRTTTELKEIAGTFPSPEGLTAVAWSRSSPGKSALKISVPGDMVLKLDLASLGALPGNSVKINENIVEVDVNKNPYLEFTEGTYTIKF